LVISSFRRDCCCSLAAMATLYLVSGYMKKSALDYSGKTKIPPQIVRD
jgi:hypothetical protein